LVKNFTGLDDDKLPEREMVSMTEAKGVPSNYDARLEYEACIAPATNQADCGSCWAFAVSSSFADR